MERATNLLATVAWTTNGCFETGAALIDADFETVTNQIPAGDLNFGRLGISLEP